MRQCRVVDILDVLPNCHKAVMIVLQMPECAHEVLGSVPANSKLFKEPSTLLKCVRC